jgi:hypothetical protein
MSDWSSWQAVDRFVDRESANATLKAVIVVKTPAVRVRYNLLSVSCRTHALCLTKVVHIMTNQLVKQRRLIAATATAHNHGLHVFASPGTVLHARSCRALSAAATASLVPHVACAASGVHAKLRPQLSSSSSSGSSSVSNAPYVARPSKRQVIPCGLQSAAAVNSITATRSVDAANHQPLTQQQLLDLGATFVRCWFAGIAKGPQAVEESLSSILDINVLLEADSVRQLQDQLVSNTWMPETERLLDLHRL